MTKIKHSILIIILVALSSCSKNVYIFKNDVRESKIILTNSSFKFVEKENGKKFRSSGKYQMTDSTLTLIFNHDATLPITSATKNITILSDVKNEESQMITIISAVDEFPDSQATLVLKDKKGKVLKELKPNFDGEIVVQNTNQIIEVEIYSPINAKRTRFDLKSFKNKNIEVKLEPIEYGGESISAPCGTAYLIHPVIIADIDVVDNEPNKISFNDYVYNKAK